MTSGTSLAPHAIQAILGSEAPSFNCVFFLFVGGGCSAEGLDLSTGGLRTAGFRIRLGFVGSV